MQKKDWNQPKYIYIPLIIGENKNITTLVKKNDYVLKGMKIAKEKEGAIYIFSPISGKVIGIKEKYTWNHQKIKCVQVENDYQERKGTYSNENKSYENLILETGLLDLTQDFFTKSIYGKTFIIDVEMNTIFFNQRWIKREFPEILETIDDLMESYQIKTCYIIIPKNNKQIRKQFETYIGTYPNIFILTKFSFMTQKKEEKIRAYIQKKEKRKYILNHQIMIKSMETMIQLHKILKYHDKPTEKYVEIKNRTKKVVIPFKIGTLLSDIFSLSDIDQLNNQKISRKDILVTSDLNNIKISTKRRYLVLK